MIKIAWDDRKEAYELCRRLRPLLGNEKIDAIWKAYQAEPFRSRQQILSFLHSRWERFSGGLDAPFDILPPPDRNMLPSNGISLGYLRYLGRRFYQCRLTPEQMSGHVLIVGRSGSGKTTMILNLLEQLTMPWIALDMKRDYRHLARVLPSLRVIRWPNLRFNPLAPPPNVSASEWLNH